MPFVRLFGILALLLPALAAAQPRVDFVWSGALQPTSVRVVAGFSSASDSVRLVLAGGGEFEGDGVFYTDPYGFEPRDASDPNAIRQYIRPGLLATIDGHFASEDAWRGLMIQGGHVEDLELEGSIGSTN